MRVSLTTESSRPPVRRRGGTLFRTWAAYTVGRAIADVAATSAADYRQFGLDKEDMLAALERLREQLRGRESAGAADARGDHSQLLAVIVAASSAAARR